MVNSSTFCSKISRRTTLPSNSVIDQPVVDEELGNTSRDVHRLIGNLSDHLKLVTDAQRYEHHDGCQP